MRRQFPVLLLSFSLIFSTQLFADVSSPQEKTKIFFTKALELLKEKNSEKRKERAKNLSENYFYFEGFAIRTMADHWETLNSRQKEEFLSLFHDRFYENALRQFEKQVIRKTTLNVIGSDGDEEAVSVQCRFTKNGKEGKFSLVWIREGERWRWIDIELSKASLVANYQGQFNKIIRDHGFSELLRRLKSKRI